jgi:hypothetical protein
MWMERRNLLLRAMARYFVGLKTLGEMELFLRDIEALYQERLRNERS